jgi:RHH-type rel operon transcriptional repressor/antitoxin RelB
MNEPSATLAVPLDSDTERRLRQLAGLRATSEAALAAEAIRLYVDCDAWQVEEIKKGIDEAEAGDFASDAEAQAVFAKWTRR